jgi:hypothetical protein
VSTFSLFRAIAACALALPLVCAHAAEAGAPGFTYPDHACVKPAKPPKPFNPNDARMVDAYNAKVDAYNSQLDGYVACIRAYVDGANADIEKIQAKKRAAIEHTH